MITIPSVLCLVFVITTWLKQRIKELGLIRRGPNAPYTLLPIVNAAILVNIHHAHTKKLVY